MKRLSLLFVFCVVCKAQTRYNYDKPNVGLNIASTSKPGFDGTIPINYPLPSNFGGIVGTTTPSYQIEGTAYSTSKLSGPSINQAESISLAGSIGHPSVEQANFAGSTFPGTASGTGSSVSAPGYSGDSSRFVDFGSRSGKGQARVDSNIQLGLKLEEQNDIRDYSAIPGEPGTDYPFFSEIPATSFDCKQQPFPGYYADVEAQCQVFHICVANRTYDFLCPNGTIFSQDHFVCVWWNMFDCVNAASLYDKNANLYDYSQTGHRAVNGFPGSPPTSGAGALGPTGTASITASYTGRPQVTRPSSTSNAVYMGATNSIPMAISGYPTNPIGSYVGALSGTVFPPGAQVPAILPTGYSTANIPSTTSFLSGPGQSGFSISGQTDGKFSSSLPRDYLPPR
ncbi:uncharacterized protein LOC131692986 [Topomyia yanbarensis]|uniref:uncharacterized protein LOC131692986 n=1 Tax=Topomyia yanbarensis TaxID=2498891 RepID=UPI00273AB837|nr:uncharacterized protein LOC131692986 [Topomyia yanbarensis]